EQSIGFLRILEGNHQLDQTPIHPESYKQTEQLLKLLDCDLDDLGTDELNEKLKAMNLSEMASELDIGELTLQEIKNALMRPGRDPREDVPQRLLKQGVLSLEHLEDGMQMQGAVRNVVDCGGYVDSGVCKDGLGRLAK